MSACRTWKTAMKPLPNALTRQVPTFVPVTRKTMFGMEALVSVKYYIYSLALNQ